MAEFKPPAEHRPKDNGVDRSDMLTFVNGSPHHIPEVLDQAIGLIKSMQFTPTCHRIAVKTLTDSCRSLKGSDQKAAPAAAGFETRLDDLKSAFASRFAICELLEAGAGVPKQCSSFTLLPLDQLGGIQASQQSADSVHFSQFRKEDLQVCLQALESRSQWWTSYSNARQHAFILCEAARVSIERGLWTASGCWHLLTRNTH